MATEDNVEVVSDYPPTEETSAGNQTETETPTNEETTEESESTETEKSKKSNEVAELQAQKEHFREKSQKLEKELKSLKDENKPKDSKIAETEDGFKERVEFLLTNRDVSPEEFDHLAAVALRNSGSVTLESLKEAKSSESEYISFLRKKVAAKSKSPGSTSASSISRLEKSPSEIAKMTPEEHRTYDMKMMGEQDQGI